MSSFGKYEIKLNQTVKNTEIIIQQRKQSASTTHSVTFLPIFCLHRKYQMLHTHMHSHRSS